MPLLGQDGNFTEEQWIFPSLQFTCSGMLTKWRFRAASQQNSGISRQCINIATWRLNASSSWITYSRRTSTAGRIQPITDDSIITCELASPVQVEPDDIVGIELQTNFPSSSSLLCLDLSGTDKTSQSYRHFVMGSNVHAIYDLVPFIEPVIGKIIMNVEFPLWFGIGNRLLEDRSIATIKLSCSIY